MNAIDVRSIVKKFGEFTAVNVPKRLVMPRTSMASIGFRLR